METRGKAWPLHVRNSQSHGIWNCEGGESPRRTSSPTTNPPLTAGHVLQCHIHRLWALPRMGFHHCLGSPLPCLIFLPMKERFPRANTNPVPALFAINTFGCSPGSEPDLGSALNPAPSFSRDVLSHPGARHMQRRSLRAGRSLVRGTRGRNYPDPLGVCISNIPSQGIPPAPPSRAAFPP